MKTAAGYNSAWLVAILSLAVSYGLGVVFVEVDPPYGLATWSGSFLTDEGFHAKAAQNALKFGSWTLPLDHTFRPAAPLFNFIVYLVFRLSEVSLTAGRIYSLSVSFLASLLFFALCRRRFGPPLAAVMTLAVAGTFSFVAFSRMMFAEPTAMCFAMASLLIVSRTTRPGSATAWSVILAGCAFLCKAHFAILPAVVVLVWALRAVEHTSERGWRCDRRAIAILVGSIVPLLVVTAGYGVVFRQEILDFQETIAGPLRGGMGLEQVLGNERRMLRFLHQTTKSPVLLVVVFLGAAGHFWSGLKNWRQRWGTRPIDARPRELAAVDRVIWLWLFLGLMAMGSVGYQPPRYFYFAIMPLCYLTASVLQRFVPKMAFAKVTTGVLALHLIVQIPLYVPWLTRDEKRTHVEMARRAVATIHQEERQERIVVVGHLAALLGLYSNRILPIEAAFVPTSRYTLCERIGYWRPSFYFHVEEGAQFLREIENCNVVAESTPVATFRVFDDWKGRAVLSRLRYLPNLEPSVDGDRSARDHHHGESETHPEGIPLASGRGTMTAATKIAR